MKLLRRLINRERGSNKARARVPARGEKGQAMLEMSVGVIFLLIIVLILFESAMLFFAYIALLNASREGAVFASTHPVMNSNEYGTYVSVTQAEAEAAGLNTTAEFFTIDAPETPDGTEWPGRVIVRVHYQLINPTQGIFLPFLGRMGLFESAWITAFTEMPIR